LKRGQHVIDDGLRTYIKEQVYKTGAPVDMAEVYFVLYLLLLHKNYINFFLPNITTGNLREG
jgi:hypothetical protein